MLYLLKTSLLYPTYYDMSLSLDPSDQKLVVINFNL